MKPKIFKEVNCTLAKDQPEYDALPAFKADTLQGEVITCWKLSFWERLRVLFVGNIWLSLLTFNEPYSPTFITTKKSDVFIQGDSIV